MEIGQVDVEMADLDTSAVEIGQVDVEMAG